MTYHSSVMHAFIGHGSLPTMIGVQDAPAGSPGVRVIGTAAGIGCLGEPEGSRGEQVWRLVVGKAELEGAFVLRGGTFIELGDEAAWETDGEIIDRHRAEFEREFGRG